MTNQQWIAFFDAAARTLGVGQSHPSRSRSWCAWTTYSSLKESIHYWTAGVPSPEEVNAEGLVDGGTWGQPFRFEDLAHVVVPAKFFWESLDGSKYESGIRHQDLDALSAELARQSVPHRKTDLILEVKLY